MKSGLSESNDLSNDLKNLTIEFFIDGGCYGNVYKCKSNKNKKSLAVKVIAKKKLETIDEKQQIERELLILSMIKHKRIIHLIKWFTDTDNIYIVTDYIDGQEAYKLLQLGILKSNSIQKYIKQLISAIQYLHRKNIIHRDIKPENIIISSKDTLFLCDFGWSIIRKNKYEKWSGIYGTLEYVCPESIITNEYDYRCDIWSIGILTYELLVFENPFVGHKDSKSQIYNKIVNYGIEFPAFVDVNAIDFISNILTKNPESRLSLKAMKTHPWLSCTSFSPYLSLSSKPIFKL